MEELFTLEREVGRGSYGVVYEGRVAKSGQRVAVKQLPCSSPESIELYLQELWAMRATAKNHVNVIVLHGCLLQTGARTLQNLGPGTLPLDLVESVLKGSVAPVVHHPERGSCKSNAPKISRSPGSDQGRLRLQDKTNSMQPNDTTPQRPQNRSRKRQTQWGAEQEGPVRSLALWLVMEYCDGGDLNHYLLSRPPNSQHNYSVVLQLSRALAFLHGLGITHRDLKPDNILVCDTPNGPIIKVADFGLSKMSMRAAGGATRQHFSSTCGSDFYMAPEVWGGLTYTAQADIFSLGVMFWAVLERITFLEEGSTHEQLGAYACKGRWLVPLGSALWENADLQLCIPMKFKRAPPLPPPPGPAMCRLLLDMLASNPEARPPAEQLEARVLSVLKEDSS